MSSIKGQVYCIVNNVTKKMYIGATINYASTRFSYHKQMAKTNGWNGKNQLSELHRDIQKYGVDNFTFGICEKGIVDPVQLYKLETEYILALKTKGNEVYNVKTVDTPHSPRSWVRKDNRKSFVCNETGEVFNSMYKAGIALNMSFASVRNSLQNNKVIKGYSFKFI